MKRLFLVRHGETAWSLSGQHTGNTDIPLTDTGILQAKNLAPLLAQETFSHVYVSPLIRAIDTCQYAGLMKHAEVDEDLKEWNYGKYEGLTSEQIRQLDPFWKIFTHGAPDGESPSDIKMRATRLLQKIEETSGDIILFSHGHFLRALATLWLSLPLSEGKILSLSPASLSILGYEKSTPAILTWNLTPVWS